ncbi:MAG: tRNA 2-thiouridine(34) synthase MnmA [Lachnospiraceae bacterium]|nr:tRNA 2-thiouridine(34) synthase MnmA [Lachnospiraceae bacterium]
MSRVIVGMSGGVDSAVAAYLLKEAGYEVRGVTLRTWLSLDGTESRCCEIDDARRVAQKLNIPYHPQNCSLDFEKYIIDAFIQDYIDGVTPNPCVICNKLIKWDRLIYTADIMKADYIATGHYANVVKNENGRYTLKKADDATKDQTYMLYRLTQEQLARTIMPLGNMTKSQVRNIAVDAGLKIAHKPDSQEICFVTQGTYADFIHENAKKPVPGVGNFVDENGKILGKHKGIINYTVGQRKGLGLSLGYPAYVKYIDSDKNEVVLGTEKSIYSKKIICRDLNFLSIDRLKASEYLNAIVKVRYHHQGQLGVVHMIDDDRAEIIFEEGVKAAARGQSAVFYDEQDCVIGGGIIDQVIYD